MLTDVCMPKSVWRDLNGRYAHLTAVPLGRISVIVIPQPHFTVQVAIFLVHV